MSDNDSTGVSPIAARCGEATVSQTEIDAIEYLYDVVRHVNDYGQLDCTDPLVDLIEAFLDRPRGLSAAEPTSVEGVDIK